MDKAEYDRTRVLPERKRATKNGKRSVDAFIKSCRDRTAVEHPLWAKPYDTDLSVRLTVLYFFFTKYITARWDIRGMRVFCGALNDEGEGFYTDNILTDSISGSNSRATFRRYIKLVSTRKGRLLLKIASIF